jgi:hypothetical protein
MKKNLSSFFSRTVNGAKKLPKKTQLLFVIGTLFTASCSSELELTKDTITIETTSSIKTVSSKDALNLLKNQTTTTKSMFKNVESTSSLNFVYQEKITNSDELLTIIPNNENKNSKYVFLNINGKIETSIITTFPENTNTDSEFTGKIIIQRLDGSFVNGFRLKNGFIISRIEKKLTSKLTSNNADPDPIELLEVIIPPRRKEYFTIFYIYYHYEDRANRGDLPESLMWDLTGGGGYSGDEPVRDILLDKIDTSGLTGKAKCLNDLLTNSGNLFVQKLLANFQGDSKFDINIISVDNIFYKDENGILKEANGETRYDPKTDAKTINIAISTSRINDNPSLDAVRTILHEYIHADIARKMYSENNIPGQIDFNTVYEKYGSQHGTMAGLYLQSMKEALKEFNKTVLVDDYKNYINYYGEEPSDAFYEALAWSGLQDNNVKAWTNLSPEQRQAINNLASRVTKMSRTVACP